MELFTAASVRKTGFRGPQLRFFSVDPGTVMYACIVIIIHGVIPNPYWNAAQHKEEPEDNGEAFQMDSGTVINVAALKRDASIFGPMLPLFSILDWRLLDLKTRKTRAMWQCTESPPPIYCPDMTRLTPFMFDWAFDMGYPKGVPIKKAKREGEDANPRPMKKARKKEGVVKITKPIVCIDLVEED